MNSPLVVAALTVSLTPGAPSVPDGWVALKTPSASLLRCGGYSKNTWQVALHDGSVQIDRNLTPERSTGPTVPFAVPGQKFPGHRHTLAVADGFLVGTDAGEWGGGLAWVAASGTPVKELATDNVRGLIQRPDEVIALLGLNHLALGRGTVRWLGRQADGGWKVTASAALDAGPETFVATPDAVYVLTPKSLSRVGADRKVTTVQPMPINALYPSSMVADAQGSLWVGMRHFVLRLQPSGARFSEEWLMPKGCEQAKQVGQDCVCAK